MRVAEEEFRVAMDMLAEATDEREDKMRKALLSCPEEERNNTKEISPDSTSTISGTKVMSFVSMPLVKV